MQPSSETAKENAAGDLNDRIQELIEANHLHLCVECGKCSAVCPMVNFYGEYVPNRCTRSVVERLRFGTDFVDDEALWYCWACKECTFFCPSGVDFQSFMTGFRLLLVSHGYREQAHFCSVCGAYLMPKKQLECLEATMNDKPNKELLYECPKCKKDKYAAVLHSLAASSRPSVRP
ncbi:MAG: 4Fe-4S dicluster domain-containing protein [Deltaproteobacteria bacterium]|nr:4Fe-4S dicluster domain-containing protein [Deltaproteobacteria bacterium]